MLNLQGCGLCVAHMDEFGSLDKDLDSLPEDALCEDEKKLLALFNEMDDDGNGSLDVSELRVGVVRPAFALQSTKKTSSLCMGSPHHFPHVRANGLPASVR